MGLDFKIEFKKIQKDWEKLLFGIMLFVAFIFFAAFFFKIFFYEPPAPQLNITGSSQKNLFGENAFAFLYGVPVIEEEDSPFNLKKTFPKVQRVRPKNDKPEKPTPPKPKPVKQGHLVSYDGWITVATGEKVAFIKVFDMRSKKLLKSDTLKIGNAISDYKIKQIDDEKIVIESNNGQESTIPIYKQITIIKP